MTRSLIIALAATFIFINLFPFSASAQDGCIFFYERTADDGSTVRVCTDNVRQTNAAATALGSLDRARAASTFTSPHAASTNLSPAVDAYPTYGYGGGQGGLYMPPEDPRKAWELRDALLLGVTVTSFEEQVQEATDRGIRDGQHEAVMSAIESLRAEISRQRGYLEGAIVTGNADLERTFKARIADLERKLEEAESKKDKVEPDKKKEPKKDKVEPEDDKSPVEEHFTRRLSQSREKK